MYRIPACIAQNISLNRYNWFEVGGNAFYFASPKNESELQEVVNFAKEINLPIKIIGLGANILISDHGFNGIIIKLPKNNIAHEYINENKGLLRVDAGYSLDESIEYSLNKAYLFGLEEFSGIPSSIGGALFINLHYYEFLIEQFVYNATIYDTLENIIFNVDKEWFEFGYDISKIKKESRYIIMNATFILNRGDNIFSAYAKGRRKEIIRHRENRYPYQKTCGCFFKNFTKEQINFEVDGKKITAASYYLDRSGARNNLRINNCFVSSKHANMITHNGNGNATDIIELAKIMQKKVFSEFGLLLEPECELIGFESYPLYTQETI